MNESRSRGIVGIFLLIAILFLIFMVFAFYTIATLKNSEDFTQVDQLSKKAKIAVVEVQGVIMESKEIIKKLHLAEKNDQFEAIIVRVNSPGGAVGPTQEIYEEMRRIDKDKPIFASFGTVAASGGYYLGAGARKIYSSKGTLTGSIGVIMNFMDLSQVYKWAKVKPEVIKAGKYKDIGSPSRPMRESERAFLTSMTQGVHEQFIEDIFATRKEVIKDGMKGLKEYAQGQIFSGAQAKELGLVDEIAGLWEAGRRIHKELKLKGEFGLKFVELKDDFDLQDFLSSVEGKLNLFTSKFNEFSRPMYLLNLE